MRKFIPALFMFLCLGCGRPTQRPAIDTVSTADGLTVTEVRFPSTSIGTTLCYRAIVPKVKASERLPVLYLLHGANSNPTEILERSNVTKLASESRLIVVLPEAGFSYYTNAKHRNRARWEDAITRDLPLDVEARFPVLRGREHTGIAGISMGGYGAVKLALKHPELYGFAGSMSGALDITERAASLRRWGQSWRIWTIFGVLRSSRRGEDIIDLVNRTTVSPDMHWFESCGQDDPLYAVNSRFLRKMRQREANIVVATTAGGHDWRSWNAAMPQLFRTAKDNLR